ncbi:hypothetical protein ACE6H2_017261 [Prunus campanulata]
MARNSRVLIRQLLGNRDNPCAADLFHHCNLLIQNLTAVPSAPSSPQTIHILSASQPFTFYSLHTPNLQFLQQRRCLSSPSISDSVSDSKNLPGGPSNLFVIDSLSLHYEAVFKVQDARLSAVFYYTAPGCRATCKWVAPIFDELCEQFRHITIYKVYMDQNTPVFVFDEDDQIQYWNIAVSSLDKLGIHKTPTFHCYLKGKKVDELAGASIRHLKKRLENVYSPSGMKKGTIRGTKDENDGPDDLSQLVEVLPSSFPETSMFNAMLGLEEIRWDDDLEEMWWFAKGMFSCQEKREKICKLENFEAKLKFIKSEFAKK